MSDGLSIAESIAAAEDRRPYCAHWPATGCNGYVGDYDTYICQEPCSWVHRLGAGSGADK